MSRLASFVDSFVDRMLGDELALLRFCVAGVPGHYTVQPRWIRCAGHFAAVSDERWPGMLSRAFDVQMRRDGVWRPVAVTVIDEPAVVGPLVALANVRLRRPGHAVLIRADR